MSHENFDSTCESMRHCVAEIRLAARKIQYNGHLIASQTPEIADHRAALESHGWQMQAEGLKIESVCWELESNLWQIKCAAVSKPDRRDAGDFDQSLYVQARKLMAHVAELGSIGREIELHNRDIETIAPKTRSHCATIESQGRDIQVRARHIRGLTQNLYEAKSKVPAREAWHASHLITSPSLAM